MSTVILVRHAVTASTGIRLGGRTDAPLDEKGREQAAVLSERLAGLPLRAVYTSPLRRTVETAEAVARPHGLAVEARDGLLEIDYGTWTDRPLKQAARTKRWQVVQGRPSLVEFPGGETIRAAQQRAVDAVEGLVVDHRRQVVVAVTHADVIKAVVAFYLGLPLDQFQRLHVAPASVTALSLAPGGPSVLLRFNDDGPLAAGHVGPARSAERGQGSGRRG